MHHESAFQPSFPTLNLYGGTGVQRLELPGDHPDAELPGISATPCATAHGAHSGTSTSPPSPAATRRVITAWLSYTPMSPGCAVAHKHSQSCRAQTTVTRQLSHAARTAGSLASFWNASLVRAAVCSAHSATTALAASQAAASRRTGLSSLPLTIRSSHPKLAV